MKFKKTMQSSIVLLAAFSMAGVVSAQDKSADADAAVQSHAACFASDIKIVDDLPKKATSKTEQRIIDKIIHYVTHDYKTQQSAFLALDHNHDCKLDKSEVTQLLSKSHIGGFVRLFATTRLIERYDVSSDGYVEWPEFHFAIDKALKKQAERKAAAQ